VCEPATGAVRSVVIAVWRQVCLDIYTGRRGAVAWLTSPQFAIWLDYFDPAIDPDAARAMLLEAARVHRAAPLGQRPGRAQRAHLTDDPAGSAALLARARQARARATRQERARLTIAAQDGREGRRA
jgi:hypothetical protein